MRSSRHEHPAGPWALDLGVLAMIIGALFAVAALQTTRAAPALESERTELINRVQNAEREQDELQGRVTSLSQEIATLRAAALGDDDAARALETRIDALDPVVGNVPVAGPGVLIVVDDSPSATADGRDRVLDIDLQVLANGLWEADAEAISINGHRLSSLTAIRSAGDAITVDYRSLTRPSVSKRSAIRVPCRLALLSLRRARGANDLAQNRRMRYEISDVKQLDLGSRSWHGAPSCGGGDVVIPLLGLLAGIVLGLVLEPSIPQVLQPYLPIAIVAAMDALFGAFRAYLEGTFTDRVFVVSFISNVLIAAAIVYVGDQIGVGSQLATAVVVVLGIRIFTNAAAIRRALFHA